MSPRNTDDRTRVLVFIDGQNLLKGCSENFAHPHCHPLLLARRLAGNRRLVGVRYYSGLHDPRVNPKLNARLQRRHALMGRTGVNVVTRKLRYRWEWGHRQRDLPDAWKHQGEELEVTLRPHQRAREKGIDVALSLDVIDLANKDHMDTAVIVSSDTDMCEVARVVHDVTPSLPRGRVSVEAAVLSGSRKQPILLEHYDYTHQIKRIDFDECRDSFDYDNEVNRTMADMFVQLCASSAVPNWSL